MSFVKDWIDRQISSLGYVKASTTTSMAAVLGGEAPLASPVYTEFTDDQWERMAITCAWVYSDVNLIAKSCSQTSFQVYEQTQEDLTPVVAHEFETLMQMPNPHWSRSLMWEYTVWWLELRGEAYWWKVLDNAGDIAQIWPLPANKMEPIPDRTKYISGFIYKPGGGKKKYVFKPEQICFFRYPNPFDYHRGLSPITAYRTELMTDKQMAKWNENSFSSDSVEIRTLVSVPENMSEPLFQKTRQDLYDQLVREKRRFLITRAGHVNVETFGATQDDMQYMAGREFNRATIDRIYGFPEGYWSADATRANSEAAEYKLAKHKLQPLLNMLSETVTAQVIKPEYGEQYVGQFDNVVPADRRQDLAERRQDGQFLSTNEYREKYLGYDAWEGEVEIGNPADVPVVLLPRGQPRPGAGMPQAIDRSRATNLVDRETKADLRRWESIAIKRLEDGNEPASYNFTSDYIDDDAAIFINDALQSATTKEEVKAAFAASFQATCNHGRDDGTPYYP